MLAVLSFGPVIWSLLTSRIGQMLLASTLAFGGGYALKARLDRSATLQAVIAKQRIDLEAARDTAEEASATVATLSQTDGKNQEVIRDLQNRLVQPAQNNPCVLDDATAHGLRRLR